MTADLSLTPSARSRHTLAACCGAHMLHDGFSDLLFVLFPVWQMAFGLSLAQVGLLKMLYSGSMASLQVPASLVAERTGERPLLIAGTLVAALGFIVSGWTAGFMGLALCLAASGAGASVQHPLASSLTSRAFEGVPLRAALSTYNFFGDVGKVILPAACAALLTLFDWHAVSSLAGLVGLLAALGLWIALPREAARQENEDSENNAKGRTGAGKDAGAMSETPSSASAASGSSEAGGFMNCGFVSLLSIGVVDSATRTGLLTLLPFVLMAKGASMTQVGFALSLIFAGGATGKFLCGLFAARFGVLRTTVVTELATAICIAALSSLSLEAAMPLLPLLGVALNGTSSVLYGTVAELVPKARRARAFGLFYTLGIGAGASSPALYGLLADAQGVPFTLYAIASVVLFVLPLTLGLRPALRRLHGG